MASVQGGLSKFASHAEGQHTSWDPVQGLQEAGQWEQQRKCLRLPLEQTQVLLILDTFWTGSVRVDGSRPDANVRKTLPATEPSCLVSKSG